MFDIGFTELLICVIVALLVLGPERLPGAVRTVGRWVGRARHTVNQFTDQIDREIRAEDLKRRIEEEMKKSGLDEVSRQVKQALDAPLPLIGADHLRKTADGSTENSILPPVHSAHANSHAEEEADIAPALRQTSTSRHGNDDDAHATDSHAPDASSSTTPRHAQDNAAASIGPATTGRASIPQQMSLPVPAPVAGTSPDTPATASTDAPAAVGKHA